MARKSVTTTKPTPVDRRKRPAPIRGTGVIWSAGIRERYGISAVTAWRWERAGRLPPRDLHIGGRSGWRPETIEAAERGMTAT
jgi:predicted DNA-binding transcriptional regulator AlpA